jgi:copper chaperone CopZ
MQQLDLYVDGMRCRRCVREVTARLRDVPGVEVVSARPDDPLVRLWGSMDADAVLAALSGTSFRPRRAAGH